MEGPGCVRGAGTRPLWGPKPLRSRAGTEKAGCDLRRSPQTQPRCWEGGGGRGAPGDLRGQERRFSRSWAVHFTRKPRSWVQNTRVPFARGVRNEAATVIES